MAGKRKKGAPCPSGRPDGAHRARIRRADESSLEDEERSGHDKREADGMIPGEALSEIERGENTEDGQRDDFLNGLEFRSGKVAVSDAVGGNLKTVLKEGDAPADKNGAYEGEGMMPQMSPTTSLQNEETRLALRMSRIASLASGLISSEITRAPRNS